MRLTEEENVKEHRELADRGEKKWQEQHRGGKGSLEGRGGQGRSVEDVGEK